MRAGTVLAIACGWLTVQCIAYEQQVIQETPSQDSGSRYHGVQPTAQPLDGQRHYENMLQAIQDMQSRYFQLWVGAWPTAIDWTAAVVNTHIASSLLSITQVRNDKLDSLQETAAESGNSSPAKSREDSIIDRYFLHSAAFYHGENAFLLRNEAFDDMLWVVLGWLEHVQLIAAQASGNTSNPWHGAEYSPVFAHRSRVFYDLAKKGWDETLCNGGLVWNPRLSPYKNAITNQLFIAASVGMYLHFPGDDNRSPYSTPSSPGREEGPSRGPADRTHLDNAIKTYDWLNQSGMRNNKGLYADGFHVTGWKRHISNGTRQCDERNEMVYTYNQGVLLSGLRGLWEATGNTSYLSDGYTLVDDVMRATGWDASGGGGHDYLWSGMGRGGVLEDYCDHTGRCNQDAQSFKGIFFAHLTSFCNELKHRSPHVDPSRNGTVSKGLKVEHERRCGKIGDWVRWNADAAVRTRDEEGIFGGWWNAYLVAEGRIVDYKVELPIGAVDYRNGLGADLRDRSDYWADDRSVLAGFERHHAINKAMGGREDGERDLNDRGRGRTLETQGAGLAVLRAAFELSRSRKGSVA